MHPRSGHGADGIGHPGPSGHRSPSRDPGEFAHGLGGKDGCLLMSHIDDAHRALTLGVHRGCSTYGSVVQREDVSTGEREEMT